MTNPTINPAEPNRLLNNVPAVLIVLLLVDSLHFVFARLLLPYLPPTTSSFYYMTVATIQIALFAAVRRQINWQIFRENARFFIIIGFLIAAATSMSFAAVAYIDPGTASLVARMNTVFALGFGIFWLKERLTTGEKVGALVAIIGVFVISFQPGGADGLLWLGTVLVLASNFAYALHAAIVKRYGEELDFTNFFLFRMMTSIFFLLVFAVMRGEMVWPRGEVWWILLLAGTVNVTISRALYYIALRRFQLSILTILLTLSPVVTILWSLVLFKVWPSVQGLLGGTAVIIGVILVTLSRRNGQRKVV
ncbi:MAG: DMT family transporter [Anaerolineales bacterium]|nr:DMT family transporter [Anaerolineales bacterium]MCA9931436.1 DMT family transporter [Anaerolineales bacterium]